MDIQIREASTGTVLAHGQQGSDVVGYEGNLYFTPATVNQSVLQITERTYTCPYKGTCNWVDFVGPDGTRVRDVAWLYPRVKPGHEQIAGRFGFYSGDRGSTRQGGS
jgi:uncharacterized protein (DUF427 family)